MIDFDAPPPRNRAVRETQMSREMREICVNEVRKVVSKGVTVKTSDALRQFFCRIFVVRELRRIKKNNCLGSSTSYTIKAIESLCPLEFLGELRIVAPPDPPRDRMAKVDLKDADLKIAMHKSHRKRLMAAG